MSDKQQALRNELNPAKFLPYASHVAPDVVKLDNGELMAVLVLDGLAFETADTADLNDWHEKLNVAWRSISDARLAVYTHTIRRIERAYPGGVFRSQFSAELDAAYRTRVQEKRMFRNEHYITLMLRPAVGNADKAFSKLTALFRKGTEAEGEAEADTLERMKELVRYASTLFDRLAPRPLSTYEHKGLAFSEVLEFLQLVMTGQSRRVPIVRGHLGGALYSDRIIFGQESFEVRGAGSSMFGGMLGVREHAARTYPGQLNMLLEAQFEFVLGQGFCFLGKQVGIESAKRKFGQMASSDDLAVSQTEELLGAMDDLQSNRFVLGEHHLGLTVFGESARVLNENLALARAALADSGIVAVREDLALEAAYWAQLPGNFAFRPRPATITSRNFAALSPFHTYPMGRETGNHWGNAIALLKTTAHSPYYFNFHVQDLGHTLIIGPSGGGKTVIQNFLLSQAEKTGARMVFIDKDRGAEIFVRASGGTYLTLRNGEPSGFSPLKVLEHTPANFEFLRTWLRDLVSVPGEPLSSRDLTSLTKALRAVGRLPIGQRSLREIQSQLPQTESEGIGPRLARWIDGGELGWVFDNPTDTLALDARFMGFDMTDFLDNAEVRAPLMKYLFHRIEGVLASEDAEVKPPVIVDIDEFWKALGDESFEGFIRDALKTWRKRNALIMFGTQSAADAIKSRISEAILEQCATKILLPNPNATEKDYIQGLHLSAAEFRLIKTDLAPESRRFLVKQGKNSVVVELDLGGLDDALAVLSGRASTIALLDEVRGEVGDDPQKWLPLFQSRRRELR